MLPDRGARRRETAGPASKKAPSFGFLKGAAIGIVVVIPSVAATVWLLARFGVGKPGVAWVETLRMATLFAGVAAVITAGGIGRLAANAATAPGGHRTAVVRAARAQAVAGAGLVLIAAIPHGHLPDRLSAWAWYGVAGAVTGAIDGVVIGVLCGWPRADRGVAELVRRVPVVAEWARAAQSDPRLAAFREPPRRARRAAIVGEVVPPPPPEAAPAEPPPPPAPAAPAPVRPRAASFGDEPTPLPEPVPLGEDAPAASPLAGPPATEDAPAPADPPAAAEPPEADRHG
jgi:hypothetical protein